MLKKSIMSVSPCSNEAAASLIRRSQFTLGPEYLKGGYQWQNIDLGRRLKLSVQQELELTQLQAPHATLTLLGYILDWSSPHASNKDILSSLLHKAKNIDEYIHNTSELGGRWILIVQNAEDTILFHDMGGLRQVCFTTDPENDEIACASQCDLLAEISDVVLNPEALAFIDTMAAINKEYWWPGDTLPYKNVRALLPNHLLDLRSGTTKRYWPVSRRKSLSMEEAIARSNPRITGILEAAANRYELALGLSSGLDSRLVLAASKGIADKLSIYNARSGSQKSNHPDAVIAKKLCDELSLALTTCEIPEQATDSFLHRFKQHSWRPREKFAAGIEVQRDIFGFSKVAVIANLGELAKLPYREGGPGEREARVMETDDISAEILASFIKMNGQSFAINAIESWRRDLGDTMGYALLDLFYWEQRVGRWLSTNQIEFDFGWRDILVPLNIRSLMCDLLATDEKNREMANHLLFLSMIKKLWPETLKFPINPVEAPGFLHRVRRKVYGIIHSN